MTRSLTTELAEVTISDDNILRVHLHRDDDISLEMLQRHNAQILDFMGPNARCGVLVDTRDVSLYRLKPDVMTYQADNDYSKFQVGMAVIVDSIVVKQLFTMFSKVYRPTVVTRVFRDEGQAREWLISLLVSR
ncbi:MAG: hypothetical protein MUC87_20655 [Bacteroidia bacterium]|jgi:hypothetical protein|nr:hypothetical protein [Bacteroidia bacterium]